MKKAKIFYTLVIAAFIFWPFISALADVNPPEGNYNTGFSKEAAGNCIFQVAGGCGGGGWFVSPASQCAWEHCCKSHLYGYPATDYTYQFKNQCANKTDSGGNYEFEDPNKADCGTGWDCCCSNAAPTGQTNAATSASTTPKFTIPTLQVPIDTVNLTQVHCDPNSDGTSNCQVPWIGEYITGIYNYGVNIAGILAAIMLMAGGLLWLVSGGDAGRITQAKELIIGSVTGLIILAGSYIILIQIDPNLVKFAPLNIGTINYPDENWPVTKTAAQSAPTYCGCVAWKTLYDTSNLKTAQAIDAKLSGTPLAGQGTLTAQLCQTTKIDPALVLAIWSQDSSYATAGAGKTNMNPGNVTCGTQTSGAGWTCNGRFRQYTDFNAAITDWFNVVGKGRRLQSANTIRDLIKTYAPPTDSNNTQGYINSVMTTLDAAHGDLKASDGSPAALQKCSDINTGC